jgi:hypothetical protein
LPYSCSPLFLGFGHTSQEWAEAFKVGADSFNRNLNQNLNEYYYREALIGATNPQPQPYYQTEPNLIQFRGASGEYQGSMQRAYPGGYSAYDNHGKYLGTIYVR